MLKEEIQQIFKDFIEKEELKAQLSFEMPKGYENAFGTFDNCTNTVYLNFNLLKNSRVKQLFNLFHELRHVVQFQKPNHFSSKIEKTLPYVIMWDGTCMKFVGEQWRECKLSGDEEFFTNLYLTLPYERDANNFAYKQTKKLIPKESYAELDKVYGATISKKLVRRKDLDGVLQKIDESTKEKV